MSDPSFQSVDDAFVPAHRKEVVVVDVSSRYQPRLHVLVHPEKHNPMPLDVKDHFIWQRMDGQRNLAVVKQDYYNKFKALPTAHITQFTRSLLERGFLQGSLAATPPAKRANSLTHFSFEIPGGLIRMVLGLPVILLANVYFLSLMLVVIAGLAVHLFLAGGVDIFDGAFDSKRPMSQVVCGLILAGVLFSGLRLVLRCGFLSRKPVFAGDRLEIGAFFFIPYLRFGLRGLLLKNWETRLVCHLSDWFSPLLLSMGAFAALHHLKPEGWLRFCLELVASAGLIDQVIQLCPFWKGALVRIQDDLIGVRASIRRLAGQYLRDMKRYLSERSRVESRQVVLYFSVSFLWVMVGSSLLLLTTATIADGLLQEFAPFLANIPYGQNILKGLLYSPMFIAFLFLLWKMVQPVARSLVQNPLWSDPMWLVLGWLGLGIAVAMLLIPMPSLLRRIIFGLFLVAMFWRRRKELASMPPWLRNHALISMLGSAAIFGVLVYPQASPALALLALAWMGWILWTAMMLASANWWKKFRWLAGPAVLLGLAIPLVLSPTFSPGLLFALPAGLGVGLIFSSRPMGLHAILGVGASLCMGAGMSWPESSALFEVFIIAAALLKDFEGRGLQTTALFTVGRVSRWTAAETEPEKAVEQTLKSFTAHAWGETMAEGKHQDFSKDKLSIRLWEHWLGTWLPSDKVTDVLRAALSTAPCDIRVHLAAHLHNAALKRQNAQTKTDRRQWTSLLQSQLAFKGLKDEHLASLSELLVPIDYEKHETIVKMGDAGHDYLEIIIEGRAVMEDQHETVDSDDRFLAELGPGDAIRSNDLLKSQDYPFAIVARASTRCVRLYRGAFAAWAKLHEKVLDRVIESMDLSDMISKLSLFSDFSASQIRLLGGRLLRKVVKEGEVIIRQGEEGNEFYLLQRGTVDVIVGDKKVAELYAGSYFGEIALIQKCTRTATIRALETSVVYSLDQSAFDHFFARGRGAQVLMNISSARVEVNRAV